MDTQKQNLPARRPQDLIMQACIKLCGMLHQASTHIAQAAPPTLSALAQALTSPGDHIMADSQQAALLHIAPAAPTGHDQPLTQQQLEGLSISMGDFLEAVGKVQPSVRREGFATTPDVTWADVGALDEVRCCLTACCWCLCVSCRNCCCCSVVRGDMV